MRFLKLNQNKIGQNAVVILAGIIFFSSCNNNENGAQPVSRIDINQNEIKTDQKNEINQTTHIKDKIKNTVSKSIDADNNHKTANETIDTNDIVSDQEGDLEIVKLVISSGVKDRIPFDDLLVVPFSIGRVYTFTVVSSEYETTIVHVYKYEGKEVARVPLTVGESAYWRTWSSKYIEKSRLGEWTAEIQTEEGKVLAERQFKVIDDLKNQKEDEIKSQPDGLSTSLN
ncbi:MAG: DUF2914 domain-containing protein [Candidatus Marinimicrobia bacterium]|jgi:hypothetical protein|nr:DUF2914 domain-containing protein [Candidatus Neomarinimicrobiota bacterium]MBT3633864.1 DUF2914 domain-containing protein [Candidatus Neomarinimicrobiota bacterium]MBT3682886.1 DUF2914 domain-containing protein [Candidatus Neomarinimicrobiota bacterium]MBT3759927.1 DUF2914 domain-containing protein [Candidatus Neomarinimicrobiota bacterium]MBT3896021.1 DUF2914 domain-containing protein [Candidatus Neomarinimicrobiota bacterium]